MSSGKNKQSLVQRLAKQQSRKITIAVDVPPNRYLIEEAHRRGWRLLAVWHCAGLTFPWMNLRGGLLTALPDSEVVKNLLADGCRVVRLGNLPHPMDDQMPAVLPDYHAYGRKAAEHFHERQFKDVGYVGRDPWHGMQSLYHGFSQRAAELGMICHLMRFKESATLKKHGAERYLYRQGQFAKWLRKIPFPLGLFTYGDSGASDICLMTTQAGFDIPTEIAVLGHGNDVGKCESAMLPLSSFASNDEARIKTACDLLERLLEGEIPKKKPIMLAPPTIVERQSTYVLAVPNPVVARALRFIWDHFDEPLTVNDVAEAVAVSRSKLDRLFKLHFPRGVKEELNRKRLEECRKLLRSTTMRLSRISKACGFRTREYMAEVFTKTFGMSPRDFRNTHRK